MSQVTHPTPQLGAQIRSHRLLVAALLALLATAAVVITLALTDGQSTSSVSDQPVSAVRGDGGPEESTVAAAIGSRPASRPDESVVAASIGAASEPVTPSLAASRPDESAVAAAIGAAREPATPWSAASRPDESAVAAAISGR